MTPTDTLAAELDAVTFTLGPELGALRRQILSDVVPALDRAVSCVAEDDEMPLVHPVVAGAGLLDGRQDGDLGIRAATVACEALATGRQTYLIPVLLSTLSRTPILLAGTPEQLERFLTGSDERVLGAFAMTEPETGSDVAALTTTARDDGDHVVLNGHKRWITVVDPDGLEWIIVWAKPEGASGHALSCFVVPVDAPGVRLARHGDLLGMRSVPLFDVVLADVHLPRTYQLGEDGRCFGLAMRSLNAVRCVVGARGLGLTARVIMDAAEHVKRRKAFGGTLADKQTVRERLASLAGRLEAARLLAYRAAALADAGELGKPAGPVLGASKWLGTELAVEAATTCMHLTGALGFDERAMSFARHLRDAQQLTIVEGVSEVQLELIGYGVLDRLLWWDAS